ncbi:recombination regulator RecX [Bordetella genomosp. 5]|nr:recombination regulator RecX [Bordetella genomosp. 5]OZI44529.1 recombination regulator RecX [Bordetella genomosp. 5]
MSTRYSPPSDRTLERLDDEFETVAPRSRGRAEGEGSATASAAPDVPVYTRTSEMRTGGARRRAAARGRDDEAGAEPPHADGDPDAKPKRRGPSLKGRAVGYLSRREYTRADLARKLAPYADSEEEVEQVIDALTREGWQSDERFAQSLAHRKASRQGTARIVQELKQSGVADAQIAEVKESLRATEYERALDVWRRRFGEAPADRAAYAKQARFLAGRGFAHDVIRRVIGASEHDDD